MLAGSSQQLKAALAGSVGTPFRIYDGVRVVASGVLGSDEPTLLPQGDYLLELESSPAREIPLSLVTGERLMLTLEKHTSFFEQRQQCESVGYMPCPKEVAEQLTAQR